MARYDRPEVDVDDERWIIPDSTEWSLSWCWQLGALHLHWGSGPAGECGGVGLGIRWGIDIHRASFHHSPLSPTLYVLFCFYSIIESKFFI